MRKVHRPGAAQGLARAPRLRAERRALRLLRAAVLPEALARALRLHGEGGRALVADLRRRLRGARGEARRRHAPRDAELAGQARPEKGPRSGRAAGKRTACGKARAALKWFGSTPTAHARAIPAPEAGAPSCGPRGK